MLTCTYICVKYSSRFNNQINTPVFPREIHWVSIRETFNCLIINYDKIPKEKYWPKGDKWDEYYFFGGEDYELVFSLPKKWAENLSKLDKDINEIGIFTDGEPSIEFKDHKKNKLFNNTPFKHF